MKLTEAINHVFEVLKNCRQEVLDGTRAVETGILGGQVENEFLPLYSNYGTGLTTSSPLASGVLTGIYNSEVSDDYRILSERFKNLRSRSLKDDVHEKVWNLKPIADELNVTMSQLAIAWCAANPNVSSVITGGKNESQIKENIKAIDVIPKLTPDVMEKIEAVIQSIPQLPES
ncbi:hypothetical protein SSX86_019662 [Deinandra increscens subsp. villosa]|uniref:NADP-dependent oxidoreductase domain-containing protein n=1 Tax=Deinandra increscens subsp. villosa TaxID=3103831 RepID=A0AAP0GUS4_9ASTR